jgi:tetratricopeptide (TPR) repeat protein
MRTPMCRLVVALISSVLLAGLSHAAEAQFPPERTKNLKVLPMDIPIRALVDTMAGFTRALGVRCTYCHVGREGEPLATYDFAADEKAEKAKAREMLRMVTAINSEHLAKLATRREPRITVTCATCHHGIPQPRPLQQVLMIAYDAGGTDSAVAAYRALRERYHGSAAYDFGEVPLVDVANRLREQGHLADALRLYVLNTEVSPNSGFAFRMAADGQLAAGDTAAAVASLRRAVAINVNDQQATRALDRLAKKPPPIT